MDANPDKTRHASLSDLAAALASYLTSVGTGKPTHGFRAKLSETERWTFGTAEVVVDVNPGELSLTRTDQGCHVTVRSELAASTLFELVAAQATA